MGRLALVEVGRPQRQAGCGDLEGAIRELKAERDGEIEVAGPDLAHSLTQLGLIESIGSTCTPSCLVTASHISPGPGRRSASWLMIGWAKM